jgi:hypothetical protein
MKNKKYHPVGTIPKISPCRNNSKNITLSEQFQKYHTVGTIPKNITVGTIPKISHCRNNSKNKISKDAKSIISSH